MEACLEKMLKNFVKKADCLKRNLEDFEEVQTKLVNEINEVCAQNEGGTKLTRTVSNQCLSVLLKTCENLDRLNMLLESQIPTKSKLLALTQETELAPAAGKMQLTKHVPHSKFLICTVTCVLDAEKLLFYALDNNNPIMAEILKLRKTPASLPNITNMPDWQQIVGYSDQHGTHRAIFNGKCGEVTLIDLGEKISIDLGKPYKFSELPNQWQAIPQQAMLCKLIGVADKQCTQKELQNLLEKSLQQKIALFVECIEHEEVHVLMIEQKNCANAAKVEVKLKEKKEEEEKEVDEKKLNDCKSNELQALYDEPLGTTNALKAILGYIPKDESRLCKFYDPKIGGCFKGARCKLEHAAAHGSDAFTSDLALSNTYNYEEVETIYEPHQILNITVTYVNQVHGFYGIIHQTSNEHIEFIWEDSRISSTQHFQYGQKCPQLLEMVLARAPSGFWHRAQVRNELLPGMVFEVYYVDLGNTDVVRLNNMARCTNAVRTAPCQARFIHLANVQTHHKVSDNVYLKGVNILKSALLHKRFNVCVVSHEMDLFVKFIDDKKNLVEKLCAEGVLERHNMFEIEN